MWWQATLYEKHIQTDKTGNVSFMILFAAITAGSTETQRRDKDKETKWKRRIVFLQKHFPSVLQRYSDATLDRTVGKQKVLNFAPPACCLGNASFSLINSCLLCAETLLSKCRWASIGTKE